MAYTPAFRSPLSILVIVVLLAVVFSFLKQRTGTPIGPRPLPEPGRGLSEEECRSLGYDDIRELGGEVGEAATMAPEEVTLPAGEVCRNVGYLCAEVERTGSLRILRWPEGTPTIRVWIPEPRGLSPRSARALQSAARRGIQAWEGHPFPLSISTRSVRDNPDITVEWSSSLGGNRLGEARMRWSREGEEIRVEILGGLIIAFSWLV